MIDPFPGCLPASSEDADPNRPSSRSVGIAVALLLVVATLPIWVFTYLPMTDLPEHMLIAKVLIAYDDPQLGYSRYFTRRVPWNPYSTYYWFASVLAPVTGLPNATRLYITLTFVLGIAGFWRWLTLVAPERRPNVIVAIPLLFGVFFYIGMVNFLFSMALLFFALALGWGVSDAGRNAPVGTALLTAILLLIWFSHPVTFLLAMGLLGVQTLLFRRHGIRQVMYASVLPLLTVGWYAAVAASGDISSPRVIYDPLATRAEALLMPFGVFRDPLDFRWIAEPDVVPYWVVVGVAVGLALLRATAGGSRPGRPSAGVATLTGASVLATLVLPTGIDNRLLIAMRAALPAAFGLVALLPTEWYRWRLTRYVIVAACLTVLATVTCRIWLFQPEMRDLEGAIAAIPPGQRVQPIITEPHSGQFRTYPFLHAAAWYNLRKGGISPYLFTRQRFSPVRERGSAIANPPGEWQMARFRFASHQSGSDYFLVKTRDAGILDDLTRHVPLVIHVGAWRVFGPNN